MASHDDSRRMEKLFGTVIFSLMFALFSPAPSVLAVTDCDAVPNTVLLNGVCVPTGASTGLSETAPYTIVTNVLNWLMAMIGIVAIVAFVVSGAMYITAGGDEKKTEDAKNIIRFTIIGVTIALIAFIILRLIVNLIGANNAGVGAGR